MKIKCLLCKSEDTEILEQINTDEICQLYQSNFKSDFIYDELKNNDQISFVRCKQCELLFFSLPITGSPKYYEQLYIRRKSSYLQNKSEYDFGKKYIVEKDAVLEIGCGSGNFFQHINCNTYMGLEFSPYAIKCARESGINIKEETIEEHSKINSKKYDAICFFQVLEHTSDPYSFLQASIKCLKPGGCLIISVPNADTYLSFMQNSLLNMPPHHVTRWPESTLTKIAELFNLRIEAIEFEKVEDIHLNGFCKALSFYILNRLFRDEFKVWDMTIKNKIKTKIASYLSKIFIAIFKDKRIRPRGHSMTAVFRNE